MNWLKRIFCSQEEFNAHIEDPVARKDPFEIKVRKPEKDISEPVYAVVEAIRKYPSRFKVVVDNKSSTNQRFSVFNVTDIKTGQKVIYSTHHFYGASHLFSWEWLTKDERELLGEEGVKMYEKKLARRNAIQRAKMKEIYK